MVRDAGIGTSKQHNRRLPAGAKVMGQYLLAGKGAGKSRMLGRSLPGSFFWLTSPRLLLTPWALEPLITSWIK
jgi:hypothetical protein